MTKKEVLKREFEDWVLRNYSPVEKSDEVSTWQNKFAYKIGEVNYGPIYYHDVPERFRK